MKIEKLNQFNEYVLKAIVHTSIAFFIPLFLWKYSSNYFILFWFLSLITGRLIRIRYKAIFLSLALFMGGFLLYLHFYAVKEAGMELLAQIFFLIIFAGIIIFPILLNEWFKDLK